MANKLDYHKNECDKKIRQQVEDRHDLANLTTKRFLKIEEDLENNLIKMFDKIEKILVLSIKNSEETKNLAKSYKQI